VANDPGVVRVSESTAVGAAPDDPQSPRASLAGVLFSTISGLPGVGFVEPPEAEGVPSTVGAELGKVFRAGDWHALIPPAVEHDWRDRFHRLRTWGADPHEAGKSPLSEWALDVAERFAVYMEWREYELNLRRRIVTVLTPSSDGGVNSEWDVRGPVVRHLEITIPRKPELGFEILRTNESVGGTIITAKESTSATLSEALSAVEELLRHAVEASA